MIKLNKCLTLEGDKVRKSYELFTQTIRYMNLHNYYRSTDKKSNKGAKK